MQNKLKTFFLVKNSRESGIEERGKIMAEYKQAKSTVRIHGNVDHDVLKAAAERFIKEAYKYKQNKGVKQCV